jgi:predicted DNA-binding mobile mystery protein A
MMTLNRRLARAQLDRRLAVSKLVEQVGPLPPLGWIRQIRSALRMSSYDLARRTRMSATRVRELEKAEVDGTIRLSDLNRMAEACNCRVFYALLPKQSLEETVWRQAHRKAIRELELELEANDLEDRGLDDPSQWALLRRVRLEELTLHFVDHHKLWAEHPDRTTGSVDGSDDGSDDRSDHSEPHRR